MHYFFTAVIHVPGQDFVHENDEIAAKIKKNGHHQREKNHGANRMTIAR